MTKLQVGRERRTRRIVCASEKSMVSDVCCGACQLTCVFGHAVVERVTSAITAWLCLRRIVQYAAGVVCGAVAGYSLQGVYLALPASKT